MSVTVFPGRRSEQRSPREMHAPSHQVLASDQSSPSNEATGTLNRDIIELYWSRPIRSRSGNGLSHLVEDGHGSLKAAKLRRAPIRDCHFTAIQLDPDRTPYARARAAYPSDVPTGRVAINAAACGALATRAVSSMDLPALER